MDGFFSLRGALEEAIAADDLRSKTNAVWEAKFAFRGTLKADVGLLFREDERAPEADTREFRTMSAEKMTLRKRMLARLRPTAVDADAVDLPPLRERLRSVSTLLEPDTQAHEVVGLDSDGAA